MTTYTGAGPYVEGRVINLDNPDATFGPVDPETAFAVFDDLRAKHPDARFEVQKRTVYVEEWKRA